MTRKLIVVFLLVILCISAAYFNIWHSRNRLPAITELQNSAVLVYNGIGHGSGVIVDVNAVLTAGHVAKQTELIIRCSNGNEYPVVRAVFDDNSDAAILYVRGKLPYPPCLFADDFPEVGQEILHVGAPGDPNYAGSVFYGRIVKLGVRVGQWPVAILTDIHGMGGCSGGPAYYAGELIGIEVGSANKLCCFLPITEFEEILPCH